MTVLWIRYATPYLIAHYNRDLARNDRNGSSYVRCIALKAAEGTASPPVGPERNHTVYVVLRLTDPIFGTLPAGAVNLSNTVWENISNGAMQFSSDEPAFYRRRELGELFYSHLEFLSDWRVRVMPSVGARDFNDERRRTSLEIFSGSFSGDNTVAKTEQIDWALSARVAIGFHQQLLRVVREHHGTRSFDKLLLHQISQRRRSSCMPDS